MRPTIRSGTFLPGRPPHGGFVQAQSLTPDEVQKLMSQTGPIQADALPVPRMPALLGRLQNTADRTSAGLARLEAAATRLGASDYGADDMAVGKAAILSDGVADVLERACDQYDDLEARLARLCDRFEGLA